MLYSEHLIRRIGEPTIYKYIKDGRDVHLSSHAENDVNISLAIEHYLVKYHHKNDFLIEKWIDKLFKNFSETPGLYKYSYILSNELVVQKLMNNNQERQRLYKKGLNEISYNWEETYNKVMNNEQVSEVDIRRMQTFFLYEIRNSNQKNKIKIEQYINKLLNQNKIPTSDIEMLLLFNYASRFTLKNGNCSMTDTFIKLTNFPTKPNSFLGGDELDGIIRMNDHPSQMSHFYHTFDQMIQCVCHETTHAIQEQKALNDPNNAHGLEMAIQKLFAYREYNTGDNYLFSEIEENAQLNGYWDAGIIYQMAKRNDISNKLFQEKQEYHEGRHFEYEYVTRTINGKQERISKEKYNVESIREVILTNPNLIKQYPVLNNLFSSNGQPKSLDSMLSEEFKSHDIEKMYEDFLIYELRHNGLDTINLNTKNKSQQENILRKLNNIYRKEIDNIFKMLKDTQYIKDNPNKVKFFFKAHMDSIIKLMNFMNKQLPIMRTMDEHHGPWPYYTVNTRNILRKIEEIKNDNQYSEIHDLINIYEPFLTTCNKEIKRDYIERELSRYSKEEQETILMINQKPIEFRTFLRTEVFEHMDIDHFMHNKEGKYIINPSSGFAYGAHEFIKELFNKYKYDPTKIILDGPDNPSGPSSNGFKK